MRRSRHWLATAALLVLCGFAPALAAQEASELERAKASFRAGANAYAAGDYLAAIQALEAAYELTPLPAIAFSLAQAERKQYAAKREREHLQRALELFQRYLEQAPDGPRRLDAQLAVAELKPQLASAAAGESPPRVQARPTRLMIVSDTPRARIALDGGVLSASPLIREVSPGQHHAHVEASGYDSVERDMTAVAGELILSEVRLPERATSLYVWAPDGADIYVDGVYAAQGGARASIPLASGAHQLTVSQKGRRVERRTVRLEHGLPHTEVVALEATTQRSVAEVLFISGGAAAGASVVLSGLAVRSENKAESFLHLQRHENVSSAQLVAYNAALVERTRFRSAAAIGVVSSLGFFITGLFLHELDQPRSPAAPRRRGMPRDSARVAPRFAFSPSLASGEPGASFQLNF